MGLRISSNVENEGVRPGPGQMISNGCPRRRPHERTVNQSERHHSERLTGSEISRAHRRRGTVPGHRPARRGSAGASWPEDVDVRVALTTPVDAHHGFGRGGFVWIFGEERGYGTDFAELGDDGKMKTIVVFSDPGPPPSAPA